MKSIIELEIGPVLSSSMFCYAVDDMVNNAHIASINRKARIEPRQGPASRLSMGILQVDQVFALECNCPSLLEAWKSRPRRYDWPPFDIVEEVSKMKGYVVATGCDGGMFQKHEWRICFNTAENRLVESLADVQIKMYILLKMVLKDIIKPERNELSSFMMKNVVFWMAELNPQFLFTEESLVQWLLIALRILEKSLKVCMLPYYMIPYRNLFTCKLTDQRRLKILQNLRNIRRIGPNILIRCEKILKGLHFLIAKPDILFQFGERRNNIEMLFLQVNSISNLDSLPVRISVVGDFEPDDVCDEEIMWNKIHDLMWPGWRHDMITGKYDSEKFEHYICHILS